MLYNTTLNLIPPNKKNKLDRLVKFIFARDTLEIIMLVYTFLATILVWGWWVLQQNYNNIAESAMTVNRENTGYNREVKEVNNLLKQVTDTGKQYYPSTPRLVDLTTLTPISIKLSSLDLDRQNNRLTLLGMAKTRDDLLQYKNTLSSLPWLENITSPTAELFQKDNVSFQIIANLKDFPPVPVNSKSR